MNIRLFSFALVILLFMGCTTKQLLGEKVYLTEDVANGHITMEAEMYGALKFSILKVNQLGELREAPTLTYLGTDSGYHFMRVWNKLTYPKEISFAAVDEDSCEVEDAKPVKVEMNYKPEHYSYHPWRRVKVVESKCFVKKWTPEDGSIQPKN